MKFIATTGGRSYDNKEHVKKTMDSVAKIFGELKVLHGDAPGADKLVADWCEENGIQHITFFANWSKFGKLAGPLRNRAMLDHKPEALIAFPGGKGTDNCKYQAKKLGIPLILNAKEEA